MEKHQKDGVERHEYVKMCIVNAISDRFLPIGMFVKEPKWEVETEVRIGNKDAITKVDIVLRYLPNGKSLFFEIKTQKDGGNAHERAFKHISPGALKRYRLEGKWEYEHTTHENRPVVVVFTGEFVKNSRYRSQIQNHFNGYYDNFLFLDFDDDKWKDVLISHIENNFLGRLTK